MEGMREKLLAVIIPVVEREGCDLVDLKIGRQGARALIRVFADTKGGITLDQCARLSRAIADRFDLDDPVPESYVLEVSSPGLDRPLVTPADFGRKVGARVKLTLAGADQPVHLEGVLTATSAEAVEVQVDGERKTIERARIISARVMV